MRKRYIQDPDTLELVPIDEYSPRSVAPMVMPDIQPYKSMQTGEMITSRSKHREHLRQHGLVEIGNEVNYHLKNRRPPDDRESRKRAIASVLAAKGI